MRLLETKECALPAARTIRNIASNNDSHIYIRQFHLLPRLVSLVACDLQWDAYHRWLDASGSEDGDDAGDEDIYACRVATEAFGSLKILCTNIDNHTAFVPLLGILVRLHSSAISFLKRAADFVLGYLALTQAIRIPLRADYCILVANPGKNSRIQTLTTTLCAALNLKHLRARRTHRMINS